MSKQTINIGASPNDGTGTPLRTSFDYTNQNFTELYTALGGGVGLPGATTQVIFNDGGTNLAGDAGLVYNKTTDALTVGGAVNAASATITGDLTVDTSTLKVDSTNDRVGVGTASPATRFHVALAAATYGEVARFYDASGNGISLTANGSSGFNQITSTAAQPLIFNVNSGERYRIGSDGISTWSVAGSTAMTLNSTGLGVGVSSPDFKFVVNGTQAVPSTSGSSATDGSLRIGAPGTGLVIDTGVTAASAVYGWIQARSKTDYSSNFNLVIQPNGGNVGVGVVPAGTGGCLQLKSGITFPATQVASSDANTLDDYEEGTFTPTVTSTAGTLTTTTVNGASYTKIGRLVSVSVDISIVNIGTASGLLLFSLPFNQATDTNVGALRELGATGQMGQIIYQSATQVGVGLYNNGTMIVNGYRFRGTYTYTV